MILTRTPRIPSSATVANGQEPKPDEPASADARAAAAVAWYAAVARLLREHALGAADRLGEGEEAEVYALGLDRVLRVQKRSADRALAGRRHAFYAALDRARAAFEVPRVLKVGETDEVCWSVERRIAGTSMADLLPRLEGQTRRRALLAYADAAAAVRVLGYEQTGYGEVLATAPIRSDTWAGFVLARAGACLMANQSRLVGLVERPDRALERLGTLLAAPGDGRPELVHGDFYPANVMACEDGAVSGVIDFGPLTVVGDAAMDLAGAVLYLTGMAGITVQDRQVVQERAREHGLDDSDLEVCRLLLAFRFLDTSRDGLFRWCVDAIRQAP